MTVLGALVLRAWNSWLKDVKFGKIVCAVDYPAPRVELRVVARHIGK
jgi:hypothetical protein